MTEKRRVILKIPYELYERLKRMKSGTGFSSVNELTVYFLRNLADEAERKSQKEEKPESELTAEEMRNITEVLMQRGYYNIEGE